MLDDIRYAARALTRTPLFALMVVVTLAIGIGANAAVFTVVNAVLIKQLPYADPDRLVALRFRTPGAAGTDASVPSPALEAWGAQRHSLERVAAYTVFEAAFTTSRGEPLRVPGAAVSPALFSVLGVGGVAAGRAFLPEDALRGAPRVAMISHGLWRDRFGAVQDLTTLRLSGGTTIVGVLQESFQFPDVIAPEVLTPLTLPSGDVVVALRAIGRLRPGASVEGAESELAEIIRNAASTLPSAMTSRLQRGDRPDVTPLQEHLAGDFRTVLIIALGVAAAILLIACANVAGLLLARIRGRERELAIRIAIGGTPLRLARLLLIEGTALAVVGGAGAVIAVQWSLVALRQSLIGTAPHAETMALDSRVAVYIVLAVLVSACLCALIPISRVLTRGRSADWRIGASVDRSGIRHFAGRALVIGQVSGAVALLIGALLLLGTLWRLTNTNIGFDPRNVLTLKVPPSPGSWPRPHEAALGEIVRRITGLPGVVSAGVTTAFPLDGHTFGFTVSVDGQPAPPPGEPGIGVDAVSRGYFQTMGIRVVSGRNFDDHDSPTGQRVAVVNETFVRLKNMTTSNALGRRISFSGDPQYAAKTSKWSIEIVGVVADVKDRNPGDEPRPIVYQAIEQPSPNFGIGGAKIVVRMATAPAVVVEPVRHAIQAVVPGATVYDVQPMEGRIAKLLAPQRQRVIVFGLFGVTAVLLAAIGLYGLLAYIVSQEMREFGIRLAIGASRARVAWLVLRRGLVCAAVGLAVGLAGAWILTRALAGMLFGMTTTDPFSYGVAAATMLTIAVIASYVPARRAMRADPLAVLRSE